MGTSCVRVNFIPAYWDPPHAYGDKFVEHYDFTVKIRIIPTRMGTSIGVLYDRWAVGDHPHAYGDKDNG